MNLKDLTQLDINDLRNIDIDQVKSALISKPNVLINIILVGVTVLVAVSVYTNHTVKEKNIEKEIKIASKKLKVVQEHNKILEAIQAFIDSAPVPIEISSLMTMLNENASNFNIQIIKLQPSKVDRSENFEISKIQLSISTSNYKNLLLFIDALENSEYAIRIEDWSAAMKSKKAGKGDRTLISINSNITLSSRKILDEK